MSNVNWPFIPGNMPEISRADGVFLYDNAGRSILDAAGGAIVTNIGRWLSASDFDVI